MSKVKVKDFLIALGKKAGVEIDVKNPDLVDLLSSNTDIPASISDSLNTALLTVEAATEHKDVRDRVLAASFGAIDKDLLKRAEELGLSDLLDEFKTEKSTRVKVTKLLEAALDAEKKKSASGSKGEKAEYEKQITELNAQMKQLRDSNEAEKNALIESYNNVLISKELDYMLASYDYADNEFGKDFVLKFAKDSVLKNLDNNKGKLILENNALKLVNQATGGELFDAQNNKVELKGILDSSVAKLLKKSDPVPPKKDTVIIPDGGGKADVKTANDLNNLAASIAT